MKEDKRGALTRAPLMASLRGLCLRRVSGANTIFWHPLPFACGPSRRLGCGFLTSGLPKLAVDAGPSYSPTTPANARVQGLPSNSSYGGGASLWFGQGARASRPSRSKPIGRMPMPHPNDLGCGRPARVVFRKTGETPVPPGLCRPSYSPTTPANARVQGLPTNSMRVTLSKGNKDRPQPSAARQTARRAERSGQMEEDERG